jgi:hypothetical protein
MLRQYQAERPGTALQQLAALIVTVEAAATSLDLEAAIYLHEQVAKEAAHDTVMFYRERITAVILLDIPDWAKLVTLGRGLFIKRLMDDEYRDIRSLFREARLLENPPELGDIGWWDHLQSQVRLQKDMEFNKRSREAELLSLQREAGELAKLGIQKVPVWMAIEDNTAGYDVLSYTPGEFGPQNKLIEVKSTIANPPNFTLTRNEWEQAKKFGTAFVFHIWVFGGTKPPVFFEKTVAQVTPHIPQDTGKGKWKNAIIPVKLGSSPAISAP